MIRLCVLSRNSWRLSRFSASPGGDVKASDDSLMRKPSSSQWVGYLLCLIEFDDHIDIEARLKVDAFPAPEYFTALRYIAICIKHELRYSTDLRTLSA